MILKAVPKGKPAGRDRAQKLDFFSRNCTYLCDLRTMNYL